MAWHGMARGLGGLAAVAVILGGCATLPAGAPARPEDGAARAGSGVAEALAIEFADTPAPAVFQREMLGRRDKPKGAQGLWATVSGLRRAESAEVVNLATGARVKVALFSGQVPAGEARLSNAAAELLGIGATPARVTITALRREPVLVRE